MMKTILVVIALMAMAVTLFAMASNVMQGTTPNGLNTTLQATGISLDPNSPTTSAGNAAVYNLCDDDPSNNVTDKPDFGTSPNYESGVTYWLNFEDGIPSDQMTNGRPRYTVAQYLAAITKDGGRPDVGGTTDSRTIMDNGIECDGKNLKDVGAAFHQEVKGKINNSPFTASLTVGFDKGIECKNSITPTVAVTPTTPVNAGTPSPSVGNDVVEDKEGTQTGDATIGSDAPKGAVMVEYFCRNERLWRHISARKDKKISERSMSTPATLGNWNQRFTDNKVMGYS
jgi:hypothetical protein